MYQRPLLSENDVGVYVKYVGEYSEIDYAAHKRFCKPKQSTGQEMRESLTNFIVVIKSSAKKCLAKLNKQWLIR